MGPGNWERRHLKPGTVDIILQLLVFCDTRHFLMESFLGLLFGYLGENNTSSIGYNQLGDRSVFMILFIGMRSLEYTITKISMLSCVKIYNDTYFIRHNTKKTFSKHLLSSTKSRFHNCPSCPGLHFLPLRTSS